jgi:hypothetical protein
LTGESKSEGALFLPRALANNHHRCWQSAKHADRLAQTGDAAFTFSALVDRFV